MNYETATPQNPSNRPHPKSTVFDHERLQVYTFQLEFIKWVTPLIEQAAKSPAGRTREVCDQLDRASISSVLNLAEGNGKRQRQVRAKFFDDARGSATECAGCLDVLVAKGVANSERVLQGKGMLLEIVCMLSGLVERFDDTGGRLHEDEVDYRISASSDSSREMKTRQRKRQRQTKS
jgi:four helix bundle protein